MARYSAYRCQKAMEAALTKAETASSPDEEAKWLHTAKVWRSRWRSAFNPNQERDNG